MRVLVLLAAGALCGVTCLHVLFATSFLRTYEAQPPVEWQIVISLTSVAVLLPFRREIGSKTGWAAVRSALKIVAVHVPLFLLALAGMTIYQSNGALTDNAVSLLVYGAFYAVLLSPWLAALAVLSQFALRPVARWTEGTYA